VLILNKRAITNQEHQLFKAELEKFKPHQTRILQANHKQATVLKDLTRSYNDLLRDKRVRVEQSRYETFVKQRNAVKSKYKKVYQAMEELVSGLARAATFYADMNDSVQSLTRNVDGFLSNRKAEGGEMLARIERNKANRVMEPAGREHDRLAEAVGRMNVDAWNGPKTSTPYGAAARPPQFPLSPPHTNSNRPISQQNISHQGASAHASFSPTAHSTNQYFSSGMSSPPHEPSQRSPYALSGYVPPPPPPGPPPPHSVNMAYNNYNGQSPTPQYKQTAGPPQNGSDPWAALSGWK